MELLQFSSSLILVIAICCCMAEYVIRVEKFDFVVYDRKLIISSNSEVQQEGNRSYMSGYVSFSRALNEIRLFASMNITRPDWPPVRLIDKQFEMCAYLNNTNRNKYMKQFYNKYVTFLNVAPLCPLKAHFNYTLNRFFVDDSLLSDLLPESIFYMRVDYQHRTRRIAHMYFTGRIIPTWETAKLIIQ
ncbi:CG33640 [Drosophila busckii]|uniref:CG33640 n=1 Tax=Drosophila busckii TaxID=30019 RepID=A0A0M5J1I6_DROBS|nr:uncharacterized protein LOC108607687 [Drosophila busckii]ALC39094.1 CG33640 [Drosophila busckii]